MSEYQFYRPRSALATGLSGRCPRCGKGRLFAGFLKIADRCPACDLDYSYVDSGDGPAVFVILIAGAVVAAAALIVEVNYMPPYWVHALLWLPLAVLLPLALLRPFKGVLTALQYKHKAREGRMEG